MGKTKTKSRSVGDSPKPPITIRSTNPKILDDNIAKLEKAIQAGDVSANPSGTAEETLLSTIGIDGKKYELGPSAENTSYDNTDSGLTATDTQAAIDEVAPALTAEGTSYDNTDSGLTADDVQGAIDEIVDNNSLTDFTLTPANDSVLSNVTAKYNDFFVKMLVTVSLASNLTNVGDTVKIATISDQNVLSRIPNLEAVKTYSLSSTSIIAVMITSTGDVNVRLMAGSVAVSAITFNIIF